MARNYHTEFAAEIYRGAGSLLQDPEFAPFIEAYKGVLREAGKEVAKQGKLSPAIYQRLEQPLIPARNFVDIFLTNANAYVDRLIAENRKS